jgi:Protein kinase domain
MSAHAGDERLGPYCLREQLGEGGMGVVYLASGPGERLVAIKVLRHGIAAEDTARRRLAHEVATMRRVSSPYVAEVIDADVAGNPPYIVTRYVPGQTLEDTVAAGGPVTGTALAGLASGLTAALAAVHSAGVVHRDLKPGNVMLVDGAPVVIDFGIAQATDSTRLTMTGMFMGTPGYLAPEVIEGRPSGPAADIHSWGATMAYAATGRPPFGTGTFEAIFYRIVHGQPDLDTMPAPLVPLVLAALARDPSRRPTAAELSGSVARLEPAALVPAPAGMAAARPAALPANGRTATDLAWPAAAALPAAALPGAALAAGALPGPALPAAAPGAWAGAAAGAWPGTRELAVRAGSENFADLLPPVQYAEPAVMAPAGGIAAGQYPPALAPAAGRRPAGHQPQFAPAPAGPGGRAAGLGGAAAQSRPARLPLVLATLAGLVAASILLPVAGAAVVLAVLVALRAADLTSSWLARRRRRQDRSDGGATAAAFFFPWAVCRSAVRFVLLAPLALLCAAGAATVAVLASGPSVLPRAGGWAAGALVACYCVGPGSAGCRRPISRFYGRVTASGFGAAAGFIAVAAVAIVAVTAAASLNPGYWPATQLGQQLQAVAVHHPLLSQLPGSLGQVGRRLFSWMGHGL